MATATFLERLIAAPPRPSPVSSSLRRCRSTARASTSAPSTGAVAPGPAARGAARSHANGSADARNAARELSPDRRRARRKPLIPTSVYAITKRDHEELVPRRRRAPTASRRSALRFFNVYGPGQALSNPYTGVAAIFASRLLNGHAPVVFEDGRQSRDFVHVDDIVSGIMLALELRRSRWTRRQPRHGPSLERSNEVAADLSRGPRLEDRARARRRSTARGTSVTATRNRRCGGASRLSARSATWRTGMARPHPVAGRAGRPRTASKRPRANWPSVMA